MKRPVKWTFCARRTRAERVKQRAHIVLRDAGITIKTQERYYHGLAAVLPILEKSRNLMDMDEKVSDWIQLCWERGDSLHLVNDALCAIHHHEPWTRKGLPQAWKVFSVWRKLESPNRAPPLTARIIDAWIMYATDHYDLEFAAMLCLGFYGLLRTGELLQTRPCDLLLGADSGVISLTDTKTGLRNAAKETVSITSGLAIETLKAAVAMKNSQGCHKVPLWSKSGSSFRKVFAHHIKRFDLQAHAFRPYSLRRGGATALFQQTGSMEQALLKGRWASSKVAKIYLADGLSYLPSLRFSQKSKDMLHKWSPTEQL